MTPKNRKEESLNVRVTAEQKEAFIKKAIAFEPLSVSDVLRELVVGFAEDRVVIVPPTDKKESLYNVPRIQD